MKRLVLILFVLALLTTLSSIYMGHTALTGASLVGRLQTMSRVCAEGYEPSTTVFRCDEVRRVFDSTMPDVLQSDTHKRAGLFLALSGITVLVLVAGVIAAWRSGPSRDEMSN